MNGIANRVVEAPDLPEIEVNRTWCKGCQICIQVCPQDVYEMDRFGKSVAVQADQCIWCEQCEIFCPDFAITLKG